MKQLKKMKNNLLKEDGFTLIETSIVLLVIAALTLLIIPNITGVQESVDGSTNKATIAAVEAQILLYKTNYPDSDPLKSENFVGDYVTQKQLDVYKATQ